MLDENPRLMMMVAKLKVEISEGRIDNNWVETFIFDMDQKLKKNQTLSPKQIVKIEELFDQY